MMTLRTVTQAMRWRGEECPLPFSATGPARWGRRSVTARLTGAATFQTHRLHSVLLRRLHLIRDLLRCLLIGRSHALPFLHAARAAEQKPDEAEHDERHRFPDGSYE